MADLDKRPPAATVLRVSSPSCQTPAQAPLHLAPEVNMSLPCHHLQVFLRGNNFCCPLGAIVRIFVTIFVDLVLQHENVIHFGPRPRWLLH